jgi:hypothetical protein
MDTGKKALAEIALFESVEDRWGHERNKMGTSAMLMPMFCSEK